MNKIKIGKIELEHGAMLAPMAGVTDKTFRRICESHGAVCTVSEMVSAKALTMGDKKSAKLMSNARVSVPYGIQIFGAEPETMGEAAAMICSGKYGVPFDFIDINMGCPAPKIVGSGAGSALLKTPKVAEQIAINTVKSASEYNVPVTVKMRIGWAEDRNGWTCCEVAKMCEQAGVALIMVHGRTRAEMYTPGIHEDMIAAVKSAVDIPVVANGDVISAKGAAELMKNTGCDAVAIGRGAMGNPWLFAQVHSMLSGKEEPLPPSLNERFTVLREHIYSMCEDKGEYVAMQQARSHAAWYMHGLKGAAKLRRECSGLKHYSDLDGVIQMATQLQSDGLAL